MGHRGHQADERLPETAAGELAGRLAAALEPLATVRIAYLFGSTARDRQHSRSDIDVGVLGEQRLSLDAYGEIRAALSRVATAEVDLVDLGAAPPLLAREIVDGGRVLVCRDQRERAEFELRARARYLDTAYLRRVQRDYLRERTAEFRANER